jgi:hypothetical protein
VHVVGGVLAVELVQVDLGDVRARAGFEEQLDKLGPVLLGVSRSRPRAVFERKFTLHH